MGSAFFTYLQLGFEHIADLSAYDHLLFVTSLAVLYPTRHWKRLLILVTAFTVGHSLTLVLATLDWVRPNLDLIELLIPVTIVVASVASIWESGRLASGHVEHRRARRIKYATALVFGLIHGLGFSAFLRAALGAEESILWPLFAFNVGLEIGQILIVVIVLLLGAAIIRWTHLDRRAWVLVVSGATCGIALTLILDQLSG